MVLRTSCMYSDDFDVEYYEEGERNRIDPNAITAACKRSMVRISPASRKYSTRTGIR